MPRFDTTGVGLAASAVLAVLVLAAFWPVLDAGFLNYDDPLYVTRNFHVRQGLTLEGARWALTSFHAANWHPLTWISHMLDWQIHGGNPAGHHLTSLVLHLANTLLLFFLLARLTGSAGKSFAAAALFGVHPLHVQSVAWIAERKDVLSTLFWLLTTWAYVGWVRAPRLSRYATVLALFALGLAAKPMLVTLPLTLLLLDQWPLGRTDALDPDATGSPSRGRLVLEKIPLLGMAAGSAILTVIAQRAGDAVQPMTSYPLLLRVSNAVVSSMSYLVKTLWPRGLAVFYPHPRYGLPVWEVVVSAILLVVLTTLAIRARRSRPYLLFGWLWYLVTLLPVIGLVQVGEQARADRYTYVPLIGIFVICAWGIPDALGAFGARFPRGPGAWIRDRAGRGGVAALTALLLAAFVLDTRGEARLWHDPISLFEHAIAVTRDNEIAHNSLGVAVAAKGRREEAIRHFVEAIRIDPGFAEAYNNIGIVLAEQGKAREAIEYYRKALQVAPGYADALSDLGVALWATGQQDEAIDAYRRALDRAPDHADAHNNLGVALEKKGRLAEAVEHYEASLRYGGDSARTHNNLGRALCDLKRYGEAIPHFEQSLRIDPAVHEVHNNLGIALMGLGRLDEAIGAYERAARLAPNYVEALSNLGTALTQQGRIRDALVRFDDAIRIQPDYGKAHYNRAVALYLAARYAEAWESIDRARRSNLEPPAQFIRMLTAKMPPPG
jgi:tetratricopeptide (TPR) repeat protein